MLKTISLKQIGLGRQIQDSGQETEIGSTVEHNRKKELQFTTDVIALHNTTRKQ
jgi:hypothetical protein